MDAATTSELSTLGHYALGSFWWLGPLSISGRLSWIRLIVSDWFDLHNWPHLDGSVFGVLLLRAEDTNKDALS